MERTTGGAKSTETLPLIVAIHGLGDDPTNFGRMLAGFDSSARILLPRAPTRYGSGYSWFEFRAGGSEERAARGIQSAAVRVAELIRWFVARRPTAGKAVVTGFSQGGMLSFELAVHHPEIVGEAIPVGGWLPPPLWPTAERPALPPVVALHGADDHRVPLEPTRESVRALERAGFAAELRTYEGVGHTISSEEHRDLLTLLREACGRQGAR